MAENFLHLSQIETRWTEVMEAHQGRTDGALEAQRQLLEQYSGAVSRYLLRVTPDPELGADLAQEFALRLLVGDFRRADPARGRFRDFLKTSIHHLVIDAHRRTQRWPRPLGTALSEPLEDEPDFAHLDAEFLECWRNELLGHAWKHLEEQEQNGGPPFHTVLRLRTDEPSLRSGEMAARLSALLGKSITAGWVRVNLLRAREKFKDTLIAEVARTLNDSEPARLDEELMNLGLWEYCRPARAEPAS